MSKATVVFRPTESEVLNEMLTDLRIKTVKVLRRKRAQQQLCLVEPRGMGGSVEHTQARPAGEIAIATEKTPGQSVQ